MKIGVIGAGVMGRGVAQRFAQNNYLVELVDIDEQILSDACRQIRRDIKIAGMFGGKLDEAAIMANINVSLDYSKIADADFIVENVPEKLKIKTAVYKNLDDAVNGRCIFFSNTSCISITKLGALTNRADKVIGVHFMNPVPKKDFAEVIKGKITSDSTIEKTVELLKSVGISSEVINDSAGFVSNRLSHLFMNEAAYMVFESVADPEQIDDIFKKGFGHKMGPLETADLIGLDTVLYSLRILYDYYEDSKFRACPLLKKMVDAGTLGVKSGQGFYKYR